MKGILIAAFDYLTGVAMALVVTALGMLLVRILGLG